MGIIKLCQQTSTRFSSYTLFTRGMTDYPTPTGIACVVLCTPFAKVFGHLITRQLTRLGKKIKIWKLMFDRSFSPFHYTITRLIWKVVSCKSHLVWKGESTEIKQLLHQITCHILYLHYRHFQCILLRPCTWTIHCSTSP